MLFPLAMELFRKGAPIKVVLLGQREGQILVVGNDIKKIFDLKGKTILTPHKFSVHTLLLHQILKNAGLDPSHDVHYELGFENVNDMPKLLKRGNIQAFVSAEPWGTIAKHMGVGTVMAVSHDVKSHHVCCVLVLRDEVTKQYPEACQELIDSLVRSGMFINAYPRQAAEIGEVFLKSTKKIILESLTHDRGHILLWDLLPRIEDFEDLQDVAVDEMHLWKKKLDLKKFINASFADHAYRAWTVFERKQVKDKGGNRTIPGTILDALAQLESHWNEKISAVGLEIIKAGEHYPKNIKRDEKARLNFASFGDALKGKACVVNHGTGPHKAIALYSGFEKNRNPNFILLRVDERRAKEIHTILDFEGSGKINFSSVDIFTKAVIPRLSFFKEGEAIWCALDCRLFLMLPLLIKQGLEDAA
jgi:NitT/TauT family transport system substrate-binding protein